MPNIINVLLDNFYDDRIRFLTNFKRNSNGFIPAVSFNAGFSFNINHMHVFVYKSLLWVSNAM